jgi:hypothetical protein
VLWACEGCGTRYAESLAACPQCGSGARHSDQEEDVPKITVAAGPSNALGQDQDAPPFPDGPGTTPGPDSGPQTSSGESSAPADPPPVSAPKAEHVAFVADALGVPPEEAGSMTKAELVELGQPLRNPAMPEAT